LRRGAENQSARSVETSRLMTFRAHRSTIWRLLSGRWQTKFGKQEEPEALDRSGSRERWNGDRRLRESPRASQESSRARAGLLFPGAERSPGSRSLSSPACGQGARSRAQRRGWLDRTMRSRGRRCSGNGAGEPDCDVEACTAILCQAATMLCRRCPPRRNRLQLRDAVRDARGVALAPRSEMARTALMTSWPLVYFSCSICNARSFASALRRQPAPAVP